MSGVPIRGSDSLISEINQLRIQLLDRSNGIDYKYTWANFKLSFESKVPTQIINLPEGNNYEVLLHNKSSDYIPLYLGFDGKENLSLDSSALIISPRAGKSFETTGCVLWGISANDSDIIVTVHSKKPNPEKGGDLTIALNVRLKVGTGDLLGKDIPLFRFAEILSSWEGIIRDIVDSDQSPKITGHKLAYLKSYQPGETYEFSLNISPALTDFDNSKTKPIQIHLIDSNQLQTALTASVAGMRGLATTDLQEFVKKMVGFAKSGGWIANLPATGGTFQITPGNAQSFLHFSAFTSGGTDACVITDFDKTTNTFTLGGI